MDILSWNVQGGVDERAQQQIAAVLSREPDVIALQEVTVGSFPAWHERLTAKGYSIVHNVNLLADPYPPPPYPAPPFAPRPRSKEGKQIRRMYANLIAARTSILRLPGLSFDDPEEAHFAFPEKHVAAKLTIEGISMLVHNTHLPPGVSAGRIKVHTFEAIRRRVDRDIAERGVGDTVVLCGDFNAPVTETLDGPQPQREKDCHGIPERWHAAEASVIQHPELRDTYRDVHEATRPLPASHFTGERTPHRYDRILASRELTTKRCEYIGEWLRDGLSDHAPIIATLIPAPR